MARTNKKKQGLHMHFYESKTGDSFRGSSEQALRRGDLPPLLQPQAIPRRQHVPKQSFRNLNLNRDVNAASSQQQPEASGSGADASGGSGSGVAGSAGPSGQASGAGSSFKSFKTASSSPDNGSRALGRKLQSIDVASAVDKFASRPTQTVQGPPGPPPPPPPPPPPASASSSRLPGLPARPLDTRPVESRDSALATLGSAGSSRHDLPRSRPPHPPSHATSNTPSAVRPAFPPQRPSFLPPPPHLSAIPTSTFSNAGRPSQNVGPGPKATVPFPFGRPASPREELRPFVQSLDRLVAQGRSLGSSKPTPVRPSSTQQLSAPVSGASLFFRDDQSSSPKKDGSSKESPGTSAPKGKEKENAGSRPEPSARTPPLTTAVPPTNAQAPPYPSPVSRNGSVNNQLWSSIVPNPAVEKTEAAPSTPPPAEQDEIVPSSDDDDDVEAELEAMRRKMAELEEKKQRKALRKSLAGSNAPGSASPAPAPVAAPASQPEPVAQAPLSTSLASPVDPNPPSPRLLSPPSPPPASVVAPTATTAESLVDENPSPGEEEQAVVPVPPPAADGPIPFGTSSQVVFSGIPEGTKELALRKFIGWALKPVTDVDFQTSYALVTFSTEQDAIEVVQLLSEEEFIPGHLLAMDQASNLEMFEAAPEESEEGEQIAEPQEPTPPPVSLPESAPSVASPARHPPQPAPSPQHEDAAPGHPPTTPPVQIPPLDQSSAVLFDSRPSILNGDQTKRKRRTSASPVPSSKLSVKQEPVEEQVVDLTIDSDDLREPTPPPPPSPPKKQVKKIKYSAPELTFGTVKRLTDGRASGSKSRWVTSGHGICAVGFHKGQVEVFARTSQNTHLASIQFPMADGESLEGVAITPERLIIARATKKDSTGPQVSWIKLPSLASAAKKKKKKYKVHDWGSNPHVAIGVSCLLGLPSSALGPSTPPSTSVFATGGHDHAVKLWKLEDSGGQNKIWPLHDQHTSRVDSLAWDDNKQWLYSGGADGRICGYHLGAAEMSNFITPRKSGGGVFHLHVSSSHPDLLLAETARLHKQFSLYDSRADADQQPVEFGEADGKGADVDGLKGRSKYVRGSWKGNYFATPDQNGCMRVWDVRNLKTFQLIEIQPRATQMRQVVLDDFALLDLTSEALFVRKWSD